MIDRVVQKRPEALETPVGFVVRAGLFDGSVCFGGEESAGAVSFAATASFGPPIKTV
jgi:phosphoglucomutase